MKTTIFKAKLTIEVTDDNRVQVVCNTLVLLWFAYESNRPAAIARYNELKAILSK